MSNSRLIQLAQAIASNTASFEEELKASNLPSPSFDPDAPDALSLSPSGEGLKMTIMDDLDELRALLVGGTGIHSDIVPYAELMSVQIINRFGIAQAFPPGGEATYDEIALKCGLSEVLTRRVIRHAMTRRIFRENRPGVVEHTVASRILAEDKRAQDFTKFATGDLWTGITLISSALARWEGSQEPNKTGWNLATGADVPLWHELNKETESARQFAGAMDFFQCNPTFDAQHVVNNYAWGSLGAGTVVDIGGSVGTVMAAVCKEYPQLHAIVQDLPETAAKGPAAIPPELSNRIEFMAHDFFAEQPIKGADIYMYRWILHDWSDLYSTKILRALAPAMTNRSKLLIWDAIVPEPGQAPLFVERFLRAFDLVMLSTFNGREREAGQWPKILHDADPRFKLINVKQPPGSALGLIEVGWES